MNRAEAVQGIAQLVVGHGYVGERPGDWHEAEALAVAIVDQYVSPAWLNGLAVHPGHFRMNPYVERTDSNDAPPAP